MALKQPITTTIPSNAHSVTPTTSNNIFYLFHLIGSPPYIYIFITIGILVLVYIVVYFIARRMYLNDPIRGGLIRQIRRAKRDVVVVNIDISTRSAQLYLGEKLSPSLYAVHDPVTGEELLVPVTSESMVGMIQYGNIHRPLLITVRKNNTLPFAIRLETLETSIPVSEYDTPEPELLAQLAKVKKMLTGYITISPTTKLAIAVDPKMLLSKRLMQELEIMSTIPTTVKEINQNLVKLLKLQNERIRQTKMSQIILIFVVAMIFIMLLAVLFGLHII